MAGSTITKQEALQYDAQALRFDTGKREHNIKIFEDTIEQEKKAIAQNLYIISQIDSEHPDVKQLKENIKKKRINIETFEDAINEEKIQIERDLKMIDLIQKSNKRN